MSSGGGVGVGGVGRPYTTVMIVPTGIGASIGGFAGDALPAAKLLSAASDVLITHPNVMNGAMMYWPQDNIMYVEGHSLNLFARGRVHIQPVTKSSQRIGVIFDKGMEDTLRVRHLQVINAARATLGIDVQDVVVTAVPWEIRTQLSVESGASWGTVEATKALGDAAKFLLEEKGCTAIALVGRFPEDAEVDAQFVNNSSTDEDGSHAIGTAAAQFAAYRAGTGVDAIAGVEAILSHLIAHQFHVPCAHAPAFLPADLDEHVSPKACAEEIGYTFLPCVLAYLHRAPNIVPVEDEDEKAEDAASMVARGGVLTADDVDAVVVPHDALGSPAVFAFLERNMRSSSVKKKKTLIIAVEENQTSMNVTRASFSPEEQQYILPVKSYAEAAGWLLADKTGILPSSLTPRVPGVRVSEL
jgi:hypothetical protein